MISTAKMEGRRGRLTRIMCINCSICVNTLRRYRALELDTRVTTLLCNWVYPQIITENDYVCEECRNLAMFSVNHELQQDVASSDNQQAGSSHQGHTNVCLLCGSSILRRQSDRILRDNPSELQLSMINILESRLAPRQPSLIRAAGYPTEKHRVTTPDGYVLQMHRIPAGRRSARRTGDLNAKGKKAILIVHGLLGSSGDFVIMGPERSLAYLLADAGYDVWLANQRGNVYTTHTNLTKNDKKFWDFSFHEHGKYDLPAMIDRVLDVTGLDKILYLGYSMGTTSFFTMMSQRPEYNEKLIAFVALAPAVYLNNVKPVANLALYTLDLPSVLQSRGVLSVQPQILQSLIVSLCNLKQPERDLCTTFIYAIVGDDYEQNDLEMAPIYMHRIQPASWRALQHYGKIAMTGVFTTFSGGLNGPVKPYNISNVKIPVSLLYGENDQLTEKSQIMRLAEELKANGVLEGVKPGCSWPKFNHLDFVFAKDVGTLLNKPLVKHIDQMYNKYNNI